MTPNVHRNQLSTLILVLEVLGEKVKIYTFLGKIIKTFLYQQHLLSIVEKFQRTNFSSQTNIAKDTHSNSSVQAYYLALQTFV